MRRIALFLIVLGGLFPCAAVAQSWETASKQLFEAGRYQEAEVVARQELAAKEAAGQGRDKGTVIALYDLGSALDAQSRTAEAEQALRHALAVATGAAAFNSAESAILLIKLGGVLVQEARYAEAEVILQEAVAANAKSAGANRPVREERALAYLAQIYSDEARYKDATAVYERAIALATAASGAEAEDVAPHLIGLADVYRIEGRYGDAEPLIRRALTIYEKAHGPDHPYVATSLSDLVLLYRAEGRIADAEAIEKRALAIREKALGPDHPAVAASLNHLADLYTYESRYGEAEPLLKRAVAILDKALGPDHPYVGVILRGLAGLYVEEGRFAKAKPLYVRALALRQKAFGADHPMVAEILDDLAMLYAAQSRNGKAEPLYKRALAIREQVLGPENLAVAEVLDNMAVSYRAQGRFDKAWNASHRAVAIVAKHLGEEVVDDAASTVSEQRSHHGEFLRNIVLANEIAAKYPEKRDAMVAESFRVAQLAHSSSTARAVAGMAARFAAGTDALAAAVRERQDVAGRRQALDAALVRAVSRPPAERNDAAEAALRSELSTVAERLTALDAAIMRDFPKYAELSDPQPLTVAAAQALLAPDEALLHYVVGRNGTWLWAIRPHGAAFYRIAIGKKALATEVRVLRAYLDPEFNPDVQPFPAARAYAMYRKIFAPALKMLSGVHQVLIVPEGALESLPFAVLVTKPPAHNPKNADDARAVAWLARIYATTILPGASALKALRVFAAHDEAPSPFAGIGDPLLGRGPAGLRGLSKSAVLVRGGHADVDQLRALPRLPETATEIRLIAKFLGAGEDDLYLGPRASEPLLTHADLERYRVIEFATHGLMSGELAGLAEPALVLTPPQMATPENDGLLTASKIATLKLDADWVVLSACNTAAGDGTPDAGGLSGLAKAFFYAGSRAVLVSHWPVSSRAAVRLTTGAFAALAKEPAIGRAEALRRSEMALLDDTSLPAAFSHPMAWAPFVLAGEGGAGR